MPRQTKCRRVEFLPDVTYYKPAGIPLRILKEVCISVDEMEAIRLKDLERLGQEQCAERMRISRPTFQRILSFELNVCKIGVKRDKAMKSTLLSDDRITTDP